MKITSAKNNPSFKTKVIFKEGVEEILEKEIKKEGRTVSAQKLMQNFTDAFKKDTMEGKSRGIGGTVYFSPSKKSQSILEMQYQQEDGKILPNTSSFHPFQMLTHRGLDDYNLFSVRTTISKLSDLVAIQTGYNKKNKFFMLYEKIFKPSHEEITYQTFKQVNKIK